MNPLAVVKAAYEPASGLDRRDPEEEAIAAEAFSAVAADEVEFEFKGPAWQGVEGLPGSGRGAEALGRAFADWVEPFQSYRISVKEYEVKGDRVLAVVSASAVLASQSAPIEQEHASVLTVRDGRITRVELYLIAEDARAAFERR